MDLIRLDSACPNRIGRTSAFYRLLAGGLLAVALGSCGASDQEGIGGRSGLSDLVANRQAENRAVIVGIRANLPGVEIDRREMRKFFEQQEAGFNFKVIGGGDRSPSRQEIIEMSARAAVETGADGTLFWYYSGHGGDNWLDGIDGSFSMVAKAMRAARATPIKRLLVVLDSCESGSFVNGSGRIAQMNLTGDDASEASMAGGLAGAGPAAGDLAGGHDSRVAARTIASQISAAITGEAASHYASPLFEELLVFSAARANESSLDTGEGGAFTLSFRKILKKLRAESASTATIGDLVKQSTDLTRRDFGHTPQHEAVPSTFLSARLFEDNGTGGSAATPLTLALVEAAGGAGAQAVFASADQGSGIERLVLCAGAVAACQASPRADLEFQALAARDGRRFFGGRSTLNPRTDQGYTLIGYNQAGQAVRFTGLRFVSR